MCVLIIGNQNDSSIDKVIDWISHYKKCFFRISPVEFMQKFKFLFELSSNQERYNILSVNGKQVTSIWYRNDADKQISFQLKDYNVPDNSKKNIEIYFLNEIKLLKRILINKNGSIRCLSNYDSVFLNKVHNLKIAKELKLLIPNTLITNNKKDLLKFLKQNKSIIYKPIGDSLFAIDNVGIPVFQYVKELKTNAVKNFPDFFFPTLFQEKINKKMDVRVFYINGKSYAMGIVNSFETDFRKDYENHRYISIVLPKSFLNKINKLMRLLNLNTGSLDFLLDVEEKNFYFLEINPNGQFGFLSRACNYNIEKEIAKYLCYEE